MHLGGKAANALSHGFRLDSLCFSEDNFLLLGHHCPTFKKSRCGVPKPGKWQRKGSTCRSPDASGRRRPGGALGGVAVASTMRVFVVSDLHTDHLENMTWVTQLSRSEFRNDVVVVAGDVSDNIHIFRATMAALKERFRDVLFVAGNHDVWCRAEEPRDSLAKLAAVEGVCGDEGVVTRPVCLDGVWFIPIMSWHHQSFDTEPDVEGYAIPPVERTSMDYRLCFWPNGYDAVTTTSVARLFDEMNELEDFTAGFEAAQRADLPVISFSHFLPRLELCPEKRFLLYPPLPKIVGSNFLEARLRALHGPRGSSRACHVFGHTHFAWDATLDGIRYVQAPLGYPKERRRGMNGREEWLPFQIYDAGSGEFSSDLDVGQWSNHYRVHPRNPRSKEVALYVKNKYPAT